MIGGILIKNDYFHLNIDNIITVDNISYYISGNVIPDVDNVDDKKKITIIKRIAGFLKNKNIGTIVDLSNYNSKFPKKYFYEHENIDFIECKLRDFIESLNDNDHTVLKSVINAIIYLVPKLKESISINKKNVLIHCFAGQNRSQLFFNAYMMLVHDFDYTYLRIKLMENRHQYIISNSLFIIILYHLSQHKKMYNDLIDSKNENIDELIKNIVIYAKNNKKIILKSERLIYSKYIEYFLNKYNKIVNRIEYNLVF